MKRQKFALLLATVLLTLSFTGCAMTRPMGRNKMELPVTPTTPVTPVTPDIVPDVSPAMPNVVPDTTMPGNNGTIVR